MSLLLGPLAAFASSFTWAVGVSVYSRLSLEHLPASVNITRAAVAFPLAVLFAVVTLGGVSPVFECLADVSAAQAGWLFLSMFSGYAFGDVLFLLSTKSIGVPAALAIASCYPFWSAIAGFSFLGENLSPTKAVGLACTVLGTVVVILSGRNQAKLNLNASPKSYWVGVLLAVMTSMFWALNAYATSVGGKNLPLAIGTVVRLGIALVLCPLVALVMTRRTVGPVPLPLIKRYFFIFMLEGFGGAALYMYGLGHSSVAVGSALSALSPAMAAPIAWTMGTERFSLLKTFGILTALVGVILLVLP